MKKAYKAPDMLIEEYIAENAFADISVGSILGSNIGSDDQVDAGDFGSFPGW